MQEKSPRATRLQRPRRITVFDGQDLKKAMLVGAAWLEVHRENINALNVFPVPDGDTGSNMSATMQAAIRGIVNSEETSAGVIAGKLSHGALLGARGNSGVILSQTLRGLALGLDKKQTFTATDLARAFQEASRLAYRAVIKPVEGTILTVVRETADATQISAERGDDLIGLIQEAVTAARHSVSRTPDLLPKLKQAGVVDSGGQGFYILLEGILRYIRGQSGTPEEASQTATIVAPSHTEGHTKKGRVTVEEEFGYEVVFLLRGTNLNVEEIRQHIIDMGGDSTVVAGDEKMLKVHTHVEWPGKVLDYGVGLGSLLDINIENLQEQSLAYEAESNAEHAEEAAEKQEEEPEKTLQHSKIATVAVVSGPGFEQLYKEFGVSAIVTGGQSMNPSTEELLEAVNRVSADQVILLPNNSNVLLSARQVLALCEKEIAIISTDTMPQGIAALLSFNFDANFETNVQNMTEAARHLQTAEITTAVRTVQIGGVRVREGDYIGIINGNLSIAGEDIKYVMKETLQRMNIDKYEIITLYFGEDVTEDAAQETARRIKEQYSHIEIEVVSGGQPHYAYILSAE